MIEVKNLVKKYDDHIAVNDLSFNVEKGQILGFLGPNGAGKSTTMNIITGYISATEGTVVINGHDIFEEPEEAKKSIGYLPELPPIYPDMTVNEYLNFVADIKKVPKSEKKQMVHMVMKRIRILDMSDRLIKHLSKGYKQRVGLAQALIGYPELIILDEPTVGLDPKQIIEIRDLIQELSKDHAIILSSHILAEISAVCDKVLIINRGHMIVSDTTDNLSKHIKGSNGLHLLVKTDRDKLEKALKTVQEISKIEYEKSMENGTCKVSVYCNADIDIREKVFYALSSAKCPILDMQSSKMSLEDIFLEVTKNDNMGSIKKKNTLRDRFVRTKSVSSLEEKESQQLGTQSLNKEQVDKEDK